MSEWENKLKKQLEEKKEEKTTRLFNFGSLADKKKESESKSLFDLMKEADEKQEGGSLRKRSKYFKFKKGLEGLNDAIQRFLEKKYGTLTSLVFFHKYERSQEYSKILSYIAEIFEDNIEPKLNSIEKRIISLENESELNILERGLQRFLIECSILIEDNLEYLDKEYLLGNSNYRGDLLFKDKNQRRLNVELKVQNPGYARFSEQLQNYMKNIEKDERILYIAPKITEEQIKFCEQHQIEYKIIDIQKLLNW